MDTVRALIWRIERELVVMDEIKQLLMSISLLQASGIRCDFNDDIKQLRRALALLSYDERD